MLRPFADVDKKRGQVGRWHAETVFVNFAAVYHIDPTALRHALRSVDEPWRQETCLCTNEPHLGLFFYP